MRKHTGWIGVDLDGTLAKYGGWKGLSDIGEPIPLMVNRVKKWLSEGKAVKIFTARVANIGAHDISLGRMLTEDEVVGPIKAWCREHIGAELEVTATKDFGMVELWDDRAVQVVFNTGARADQLPD